MALIRLRSGWRSLLLASVLASWSVALSSAFGQDIARAPADAPAGNLPAANAPETNAPASATPTVYEAGDIYLPESRVYVFVDKRGIGHEHGVVGQLKQGRLLLDAVENAGQLVFDMVTFTADSDAARQYVGLTGATDASDRKQVTATMRSAAVLNASRFPTATFAVHSIAKMSKPSARNLPQYELLGDFTLHGVEQPIQVVADAEEQQGWIHLRGGFTLSQTQFGIRPYTKAFGAVGVANELKVYGDIWVAKERETSGPATH